MAIKLWSRDHDALRMLKRLVSFSGTALRAKRATQLWFVLDTPMFTQRRHEGDGAGRINGASCSGGRDHIRPLACHQHHGGSRCRAIRVIFISAAAAKTAVRLLPDRAHYHDPSISPRGGSSQRFGDRLLPRCLIRKFALKYALWFCWFSVVNA